MSSSGFPGLGSPSGGPARPSSGDSLGGLPAGGSSAFPGLPPASPWEQGGSADSPGAGGGDRQGPPIPLLLGALAAPLVTVPLLWLEGWGWHVLGWAVATFVAAGLLILATLEDTRRRASAWYLGNEPLVRALRLGAVLLALLAAAAHAWLFADWFARLEMFAA